MLEFLSLAANFIVEHIVELALGVGIAWNTITGKTDTVAKLQKLLQKKIALRDKAIKKAEKLAKEVEKLEKGGKTQ